MLESFYHFSECVTLRVWLYIREGQPNIDSGCGYSCKAHHESRIKKIKKIRKIKKVKVKKMRMRMRMKNNLFLNTQFCQRRPPLPAGWFVTCYTSRLSIAWPHCHFTFSLSRRLQQTPQFLTSLSLFLLLLKNQ